MDTTRQDVDGAIGTALGKTEVAEAEFVNAVRSAATGSLLPLATRVERRAEDLHELSADAVMAASRSPGRRHRLIGFAIAVILMAWLARRLGADRSNPWSIERHRP